MVITFIRDTRKMIKEKRAQVKSDAASEGHQLNRNIVNDTLLNERYDTEKAPILQKYIAYTQDASTIDNDKYDQQKR